jgi:hypothetical protein
MKAKYGGMELSDAKRLKRLEDENSKLKRLVPEVMLDRAIEGAIGSSTMARDATAGCRAGQTTTRSSGITSIRASRSRTAISSHSTAACAPLTHVNMRCRATDECLNEEIFGSLADARRKLAIWRYDYNNVRPHSALGNKPPQKRAERLSSWTATRPTHLPHPKTTIIKPKHSRYD